LNTPGGGVNTPRGGCIDSLYVWFVAKLCEWNMISSMIAIPYVEMLLHQFVGNILVLQCVIFAGTVRTGPHPVRSKLVWLVTRAGDELQSSR
jgi:hypothetical protein